MYVQVKIRKTFLVIMPVSQTIYLWYKNSPVTVVCTQSHGVYFERWTFPKTRDICYSVSIALWLSELPVMSNPIMHLLLLPTRLSLWILSLVYYILVYGTAGITACLVLIRIAWTGFRDPCGTFQWTVRKKPPDCLKDPALGDHAYLKGRVRAFIMWNISNYLAYDVCKNI